MRAPARTSLTRLGSPVQVGLARGWPGGATEWPWRIGPSLRRPRPHRARGQGGVGTVTIRPLHGGYSKDASRTADSERTRDRTSSCPQTKCHRVDVTCRGRPIYSTPTTGRAPNSFSRSEADIESFQVAEAWVPLKSGTARCPISRPPPTPAWPEYAPRMLTAGGHRTRPRRRSSAS